MSTLPAVEAQLKRFKTVCKNLRESYKEAMELKKQGAGAEKIKECTTNARLMFLELKSSNRSALLAAEKSKQRVRDKKKEMDQIHLRLQSKLYEQHYLDNEIKRCQDFTTTEMNKIELLPDADVPQSAWGSSGDNEHRKHLARLQHELSERKRLKKEVSDLKIKTKATGGMTAEKVKFLDALPGHVKALEKATEPLQLYISLPVSKKVQRQGAAHRLPTPLYVLFCQLEAHADSLDEKSKYSVVVDIVNSNAPPAEATAGTITTVNAAQSGRGKGKKRGREEDDSAPSTKRLKTAAGATSSGSTAIVAAGSSTAITDSSASMTAQQIVAATSTPSSAGMPLYTPDPTAVSLTLSLPKTEESPANTLKLRFQYIPALRIVTAELEGVPASDKGQAGLTLCDLYPNDSGDNMPHLSTEAAVTATLSRTGGLSPALPGRPYKWLQWLCGLYRNEMSSSSSSSSSTDGQGEGEGARLERQQASTAAVLGRLHARVRSRHALESQLKTLSSTPGVVPLPAALAGLFTGAGGDTGAGTGGKGGVKLSSWLQLKTKENLESVTKGFAVMDYPGDATLKAEREQEQADAGSTNNDRRRFFKAVFKTSGSGARQFSLIVEISASYPMQPPRVLLQDRDKGSKVGHHDVTYDNLLKAVETEVNAYYHELLAPGLEDWLLSCQLRRVQLCFDVLNSIDAANASCAGNKGSDAQASLPPNPFARKRRGRDRRRPFMLDPASRTLVHR